MSTPGLKFRFKIYCKCTFREDSAVARGDSTSTQAHFHLSCRKGLARCPYNRRPPSPAASSSLLRFRVRQAGAVRLGAQRTVCRLRLNFSAAAVGFPSGRSGSEPARRLSLLSPPSVLSSGPSPPFSFRPQIRTLSGSFPGAAPRCARRVGAMKRH